MPIHAIQMKIVPGQPEKNLARAIEFVEQGGNEDPVWLFVFPEMAIPGYFIGDQWRDRTYMQECHEMTDELVAKTQGGLGIIFGNVTVDFDRRGENGSFQVYNSAIVAYDGKLVENEASKYLWTGRTHKSLLPNYGMFHDKRHFTSMRQLAEELGVTLPDILRAFELPINGQKEKIWVIICEDMWDHDYRDKPTDMLRSQGATHMVNLSSSPFSIGKAPVRDAYLKRQSAWFKEYWYVNNIGRGGNGKNEHAFDGSSVLFSDGQKVMQARSFQEWIFDAKSGISEIPTKGKEIYNAIIYALRQSWESLGHKKVVIGLSGGIDSALSATLIVAAIGAENVIGVNMPSEYNGEILKWAAKELADKLNITYHIVPLSTRVSDLKEQVEMIIWTTSGGLDGLAEENMQARHRSSGILSAVASHEKVNGMYTNNGNKTEVFTGYCTLYGDVNGFMAPLADLYKTQVRSLAHYCNTTFWETIPTTTLEVAASAELSATQTVGTKRHGESPFRGESGDPFVYPYHDALFYQIWDLQTSPAEILKSYQDGTLAETLHKNYDTLVDANVVPDKEIKDAHANIDQLIGGTPAEFIEDIERVYRLLRKNFFKRIQAPTIIAVSRRPFGYDTHEAENRVYFGREYDRIKKAILWIHVSISDPHIQRLIREKWKFIPKTKPVLARLPTEAEIGHNITTYIASNGQLKVESKHPITVDTVICRNEWIIGQIDGVDIYNEWPRDKSYWESHYGDNLGNIFQSVHKKTVASLLPASEIWDKLGGKPDEHEVQISVPWWTGTMTIYRDGYISSDGNGIALEEYLKTYT